MSRQGYTLFELVFALFSLAMVLLLAWGIFIVLTAFIPWAKTVIETAVGLS